MGANYWMLNWAGSFFATKHTKHTKKEVSTSATGFIAFFAWTYFGVLRVFRGKNVFVFGVNLDRRRREAAVNDDVLAGDERRRAVGSKPNGGAGEFVRLAETAHRRVANDLAAAFGVPAVFLE